MHNINDSLNSYFRYLILINIFCVSIAHATPYIPNNPNEVLEILPVNSSTSSRVFKDLRGKLSADPNNVGFAVGFARLCIERSRIEGDPRYLGYAQSALSPWWKLTRPPLTILVLRATLLQSTHHFDQALQDLNKVISLDRTNGQAWITRATILQVQGKYAEALKSCEQLYTIAPALVALTCIANIRNLSGHAIQSYHALKMNFERNKDLDPSTQVWIVTLLAEMAARIGDNIAAEKYFQEAIAIEVPDSYLLGAYSDFLLDQNRPQKVITLLKNKTRVDALLLRYAEALTTMHSPEASLQIESLKQRFAAAMLRGDTVHQREQSRFELRLMHNPDLALEIAKLNWKIQKEPADARVYLEAAVASKNKNGALPIIYWLSISKLEDISLEKLKSNSILHYE